MIHYYPLGRSIGMFIVGAFGFVFNVMVFQYLGTFSFLLGIMGVVAIYTGFIGITRRKKEPMTFDGNTFKFYRRGVLFELNKNDIEKVFYNTKGIDKRVTILTTDKKEIDIPTVYGLYPLAKKMNKNLGLLSVSKGA